LKKGKEQVKKIGQFIGSSVTGLVTDTKDKLQKKPEEKLQKKQEEKV
jgi:hypothetical protein